MIRATSALLIILLVAPYLPGRDENAWNGILPLHSTRSDVEKRYGAAAADCHCAYSTPSETIRVDYSKGPCKGPPYGWNVPADTVLGITVFPKVRMTVAESELLAEKYVKSRDISETTVYYTSVLRGVRYAFQYGQAYSVSYIPSGKDLALRCAGFPTYEGGIREYHPYAAFSSSAQFITDRFDEFALQLENNPILKGYIITYAGAVAKKGEARMMAENAKRRIVERRKITRSKIITIDGGFRETAEYELFLVPPDMLPPAPTPTVASNEAQIIAAANQNRRRPSIKLRN